MWSTIMFAGLTLAVVVVVVFTCKKDFGKRVGVGIVTVFLLVTCLIAFDHGTGKIPTAEFSKALKTGNVYKTQSVVKMLEDRGNHLFVKGYITVLKTEKGDHIVRLLVSEPPKYFIVDENGTYVDIQPQKK